MQEEPSEASRESTLLVDVFAVFDGNYEDGAGSEFDAVDDSVVADTQSSVPFKAVAQRFAEAQGIHHKAFFNGAFDKCSSTRRKSWNIFAYNGFQIANGILYFHASS